MTIDLKQLLLEDIGREDVTTNAVVSEDRRSKARIIAKDNGVIAGHEFASGIFKILDASILYEAVRKDGELITGGETVAIVEGRTRAILTGERVALNILQRLSGIATLTSRFVKAVEGTGTIILDTRKTTPGLREIEKYAVRIGGGKNHRMNLTEMALIKENHISAAGSITRAVDAVRAMHSVPIEIEVKNMDELEEALACNVDMIMLDNWELESTRMAVKLVHRKVPLEASGNMNLDRVRDVAQTGVEYISVGALTHSYPALDLSLLFEEAQSD